MNEFWAQKLRMHCVASEPEWPKKFDIYQEGITYRGIARGACLTDQTLPPILAQELGDGSEGVDVVSHALSMRPRVVHVQVLVDV
jgi:hypothetical protein